MGVHCQLTTHEYTLGIMQLRNQRGASGPVSDPQVCGMEAAGTLCMARAVLAGCVPGPIVLGERIAK